MVGEFALVPSAGAGTINFELIENPGLIGEVEKDRLRHRAATDIARADKEESGLGSVMSHLGLVEAT